MADTVGPSCISIESNSRDETNCSVPIVPNTNTNSVRNRNVGRDHNLEHLSDGQQSFENSCVVVPQDVNDVEAQRIANNYYVCICDCIYNVQLAVF